MCCEQQAAYLVISISDLELESMFDEHREVRVNRTLVTGLEVLPDMYRNLRIEKETAAVFSVWS
jgi:hypothetical protein